MADVHLAAPGPDELLQSLPTRDFAQPGSSRPDRAMAVVRRAVPQASAWEALSPERAAATLITAVAVLLRHHTRRSVVAVVLRHGTPARPLHHGLRVDVDAARSVDELVQAMQRIVGSLSDTAVPTLAVEHGQGVVIDLTRGVPEASPPAADLAVPIGPSDPARIDLWYDQALFRAESAEPLARQLAHLLSQAVTGDTRVPPLALPLMDAIERERVLRGFNALRAPFPIERTLADLIAEQRLRHPDGVCIVHGRESLTYSDLDRRAGLLARQLVSLGAGPGTFVAVVDRRGIDFAVAMAAIWQAGAAYIPIDPGYPAERVRLMLADSESAIAVAGTDTLTRLAGVISECPALRDVVSLRATDAGLAGGTGFRTHVEGRVPTEPAAEVPRGRREACATDPAYMIYTSGSTGRPKGAIVRHDGAVNHLFAQALALGRDAVARFLQTAPSSSDISVWQFAAPLAFGGTAVVIDDPTDVANLLHQVRQHGLHVIELVPAVLKHLVDFAASLPAAERALPSLRWAMVTGESAPVELVNAWLALYPQVPVVNAYGPSEASDDVAQAILREPLDPRQTNVPIGRPLANLDLYVLDDRLEPQPVGVPGEICVAGVGVGAGYWKQPEKTRQSFVANPFAGAAGPVIYRTGDLGRWRDDGTLECLGRLDHQVQLRGFRIELQEIEAVLRQHPSVRDAVVQAFHDGRGDGQLVAYVVDGAEAADDDGLRAHLAARLPQQMVPTAFVRLPALPLNPAGKVDRKALVPPSRGTREGSAASAPPRGAAEQALAAVWQRELGVVQIGRDDDFFALGGDSLSALAIVVGARAAGWQIRSADVLAEPTIARLAGVARPVATQPWWNAPVATDPVVPPLPAADVAELLAREPAYESVWPLSPPQQGMYLHWLMARDKTAYVDRYDYELFGELDPAPFEEAWNLVVARHEALRTAFLRSALRQPVQAVHRALRISLNIADLSNRPAPEQQEAMAALAAAEVAKGFDLARPPLMRLTLARLSALHHRLMWTHHHIVLDGWSLALVLDEVLHAHAALAAGCRPQFDEAVPYGRYLEALARVESPPSVAYWRDALAGWPGSPPLPWPSPAQAPLGFGEVDLCLDEGTTARLADRARSAGITFTTMLQAAWAAVLGDLTGQSEAMFGVVNSGRDLDLPGLDRAVGLFVTTLPLRVPLKPKHDDLTGWLGELQQRAALQRPHDGIPLSRVAAACGLPPGKALFETIFVMANFPQPGAGQSDQSLRIVPSTFRTVPAYPLTLVVTPAKALHLRLVHDRQRISETNAAALVAALARLIEQMSAGADPRTTALTSQITAPAIRVQPDGETNEAW